MIPPEQPLDISGPEALVGRAAHDAIEEWILGGCHGEPEPQPAANRHGVQPEAITDLIAAAPAMLGRIREDISGLRAEVPLIGGGVRGRADVLAITETQAGVHSIAVLDWKTGRDPWGSTKPGQRLGYASAAEASFGMPALGYVYTAELWLATGDILESRFDLEAIDGLRDRLAMGRARPVASPGPHCKWCRRRHECTQRQAWMRSTARSIAERNEALEGAELLAGLWDQSRALKQALGEYEAAVDNVIACEGGLDLPDGRRLQFGTKTLETIDARAAWPVMQAAGLDHEAINRVLKVSKTKLLSAVGRRAPRGSKGDAKENLLQALDSAGAIDRKVSTYRRTVGKPTTED